MIVLSSTGSSNSLMTFLPLIAIIAVMYLLLIRPQQKKTKQVNEMRNTIKAGDYVTTIGGFKGRVVKIRDDVVTIAVGTDKTKLEIMRWGISKVDEAAAERPAARKSAKEREEELEEQAAASKPKPKKLTKAPAKTESDEEPEDAADIDDDIELEADDND
ncbi:MAG: preprotein translocase subunit YajC [Clostridiales Family XIII bacterium]|jgi:preprotein translocase subunit YajC|nr:preprotein translocase subunit YajC [Clostridiales Family XIII bacterium]